MSAAQLMERLDRSSAEQLGVSVANRVPPSADLETE
jgi:hypothetical protein